MNDGFGFRDGSVCAICRSGGCTCDELTRLHGVRPVGRSTDEDLDDADAGAEDRAFAVMYDHWLNDPLAWNIAEIIAGTEKKRKQEHHRRGYNRKQDIKRGKISGKPTGWKQQSIDEAKAKGLPGPPVIHNIPSGETSPL